MTQTYDEFIKAKTCMTSGFGFDCERGASVSSPTSRTLECLRKNGWLAQVVEKWVPQCRRRIDLFGFIDIVAIHPDRGILGVQATSTSNFASRITKAKTECKDRLSWWLRTGGRFAVCGWSKKGKAGQRKLWVPRWQELDLDHAISESVFTETVHCEADELQLLTGKTA